MKADVDVIAARVYAEGNLVESGISISDNIEKFHTLPEPPEGANPPMINRRPVEMFVILASDVGETVTKAVRMVAMLR